ncbi:unnamed protein product, partial [Iphiclides podalirius]
MFGIDPRELCAPQGVLARYEEAAAWRSACTVYSAALLRARAALGAQPPARAALELAALEAMRRAIEFNPFVPAYLLELRPLALPPEHVVRRGDSEALAYAFWHLRHWRHVDGALRLLAAAAQAQPRRRPAPALGRADRCRACGACGDRELLGGGGGAWGVGRGGRVGRGGGRRGPGRARAAAVARAAAALCVVGALAALALLRWPRAAAAAALLHPAALMRLLTAV